jgi:transposase
VLSVLERLGSEGVAQLVADYEAGEPSTGLTKKYGVGKGTVLRLLRQYGATMRQQPMSPDDAAQAIALYKRGWSLARVGHHFGREHSVIRDILERAGIARRDVHGRERSSQ